MGANVKDGDKPKAQLLQELELLRQRLAQMEEDRSKDELREKPWGESDQGVSQKLASILSPEGDIGNLELSDIIDVPAVQSLLNDFYALTHFPVSILDLEGKMLAGVGWQDICTNFHRVHPETCQHCLESDTQLSAGVSPGEFKLYKCKNHMWDIATPILVGDKKLGNLFSGQFFFEGEPLDYDLFRSQAGQYGFNEAEYIAALERVPRLTRETVEVSMAFLVKLAHMLSLPSYANIKLAGSLAERDALMESLRESETRFRSLFENMTEGVALHELIYDDQGSAVDYRIIATNPAFEKHTGLKSQQVTGRLASSAYGTRTAPYLKTYAQVAHSGQPCAFEAFFPPMQRHFHISVTSPKQGQFVTVFEDITARKQTEEALSKNIWELQETTKRLEQSKKMLQLILESIPVRVFWKDSNLRYLGCNTLFARDAGFSHPQQLLGKDDFAMGWKEQAEIYRADDRQIMELRRPKINIVEPQTTPAGDKIWLNTSKVPLQMPNGEVFGVLGVYEDITERKRMQEAMRDNEQFLTDIFNSIQDGLSILDTDFNIIRVNPAMEAFGYTQPLVGRKCYEVYHGRSEPCEVCPCRQTLLTGKATREIVTEHLADGSDRFMEIQAFPLLNRTSGQAQAVIEYVRDVTERQRAEAERLRLSKLESLATLAGGIAHDFNNILTAIMGNISLAALELQNEERSRERLTEAERACLQAQTLARQLLTFAKGGLPIKEPIAVEKIITESAAFSCRGSRVRCEFAFPTDVWAVEADPGQINQVFQNLVINAIQAMPSGGTIKIRGENLVVTAGSNLSLDHGRYVKISVADQGVGMPEDYLGKIFDPFFSTKQTGSGLGLATAYSIVKNHHGHISVQSKLGVGTVFEVYLPACDQKIIPVQGEDRGLLTGKGKILVMDDEELVRQVLAKILERLGYEAEFASDGNEAIEQFNRAREAGEAFAAVILDLTVPGGMGGKEVIEKLLEIDPQVRALVSSGYSEDPIMAEYEKYGFSGIIAKPYKVSELGKVLHQVILAKT